MLLILKFTFENMEEFNANETLCVYSLDQFYDGDINFNIVTFLKTDKLINYFVSLEKLENSRQLIITPETYISDHYIMKINDYAMILTVANKQCLLSFAYRTKINNKYLSTLNYYNDFFIVMVNPDFHLFKNFSYKSLKKYMYNCCINEVYVRDCYSLIDNFNENNFLKFSEIYSQAQSQLLLNLIKI